eukprot:jgi/Galph1/4108/GphlegSOOS_G2734.1
MLQHVVTKNTTEFSWRTSRNFSLQKQASTSAFFSVGDPKGVQNLGESCHLSAVLVALSSSEVLIRYLKIHLSDSQSDHLSGIISALLFIGGQKWIGGHVVSATVIRPTLVARILLEQGHDAILPQDAEETWTKLCFFIEGLLRVPKSLFERLNDHEPPLSVFDASLDSPFFGIEQQMTFCKQCGFVLNIRLEPIRTIRVPLVTEQVKITTLFDCLHKLWIPEEVEIVCEKCLAKVMYRAHRVVRMPTILCIHIQRVSWSQQLGRLVRSNQPLLTPLELDEDVLQPPREKLQFGCKAHRRKQSNLKYTLKAVIRHHGTTFYGHYTTAIRVAETTLEGLCGVGKDKFVGFRSRWHLVDDERVLSIDEKSVVFGNDTYMCVYEKATME